LQVKEQSKDDHKNEERRFAEWAKTMGTIHFVIRIDEHHDEEIR
jgi:hypothetical protein